MENWEKSRLQQTQAGRSLTKDSVTLPATPRFSRVKPHHVQQAAVQIQDQYMTELQAIESKADAICSRADANALESEEVLTALQEIDELDMEGPITATVSLARKPNLSGAAGPCHPR
jgi:hypothetical protein